MKSEIISDMRSIEILREKRSRTYGYREKFHNDKVDEMIYDSS